MEDQVKTDGSEDVQVGLSRKVYKLTVYFQFFDGNKKKQIGKKALCFTLVKKFIIPLNSENLQFTTPNSYKVNSQSTIQNNFRGWAINNFDINQCYHLGGMFGRMLKEIRRFGIFRELKVTEEDLVVDLDHIHVTYLADHIDHIKEFKW